MKEFFYIVLLCFLLYLSHKEVHRVPEWSSMGDDACNGSEHQEKENHLVLRVLVQRPADKITLHTKVMNRRAYPDHVQGHGETRADSQPADNGKNREDYKRGAVPYHSFTTRFGIAFLVLIVVRH